MQPTAGPRLCQETKEESLLVCLPCSPWARGGKYVRAAAAGARTIGRPETAHLFLPSPYLQRQAWEGGQGGQPLCPALRWAPPPGAGRGAARETPGRGGRLFGAGGTRVQLRLSRPPSIWRGVSLHAYCAHAGGPPRAGGWLSGSPLPSRPATLAATTLPSPPSAPVLRAGAPGHIRRYACKLCLSNRLWGASLVGNRVLTLPLPSVTCRRLFLRGAGSPRFVCQQ